MKKVFFLAIFIIMPLVCFAQDAKVPTSPKYMKEHKRNVYHFIFRESGRNIPNSIQLNNKLFDVLQKRIDSLGIEEVRIYRTEDNLIVLTAETTKNPQKIISGLNLKTLPIPLELVNFFKCDFAHKDEFAVTKIYKIKEEEPADSPEVETKQENQSFDLINKGIFKQLAR